MGVITRTIWTPSAVAPGGIALQDVPDADAYGLAISVANATERATLVPADFYDGTLVVQMDTRQLYVVDRVANAILPIAPAVVRFKRFSAGTVALTANSTYNVMQFITQDLIAAATYRTDVFFRAIEGTSVSANVKLNSGSSGGPLPDSDHWFESSRNYGSALLSFINSGSELNLGNFRVSVNSPTGMTLHLQSMSFVMVTMISAGPISGGGALVFDASDPSIVPLDAIQDEIVLP